MSTPEGTAEDLLVQADRCVRTGQLDEAVLHIAQAAQIYADAGLTAEEARCRALAAAAARMAGNPDAPREPAGVLLPGPVGADEGGDLQATAEIAESLLAAEQLEEAIEKYSAALELLHGSGVHESAIEAVLLRKRGLARAQADQVESAIHDLQAAACEFVVADQPREHRAVLVEAATLATERSTAERGQLLRERARRTADQAQDSDALVDLDLLEAALAIDRRDLDAALDLTVQARQRALDASVPLKYLAAAVALSDLHDLRGEREDAYEALTTGWETLEDLVGGDAARVVVQPRLQRLVQRWGAPQFRAVQTGYEQRRRRELGRD